MLKEFKISAQYITSIEILKDSLKYQKQEEPYKKQ